MDTIFEAGKEKFNMTEDKIEVMKVLVIKQFLKKQKKEMVTEVFGTLRIVFLSALKLKNAVPPFSVKLHKCIKS